MATVQVAARSPSVLPKTDAKVNVQVLVTGGQGAGKLWIAADCVPWLLAYLADEVNTGGVAIEPGEPQPPAAAGTSPPAVAGRIVPNCKTPGLAVNINLENGSMDKYEAVFVDGPLKGALISSKISTMNQDKWDKCQATAAHWQCPGPLLANAGPQDKARAVAHYLELTAARRLLQALGKDSTVDDPITAVAERPEN